MVTEVAEQNRRVDDVGEDDCHGALGVRRLRNVRLSAQDDLFQLLDRDGQRSSEGLDLRLRERPMRLDDLPLAMFEPEDVSRSRFSGLSVHADGLFQRCPADASFLPSVDLVCPYGEDTPKLLDLTTPNRSRLAATPPLGRVCPHDERAFVCRQPLETLGIPVGYRSGPTLDYAPDLLRFLHAAECAATDGQRQPDLGQRAGMSPGRAVGEMTSTR